jgi:uncharacterized RDD family membrane protein YckC
VEETIEVTTAENVAFSYALAGLGSRFLAVLLDLMIQLAIAAVVALILALFGFFTLLGHKSGQAIALSIGIVLFFAIFYAYFVFFEADDGRTPGKRLIGIRVVRDGGFPLDIGAAVVRNLVRVGELLLGYYAIAAVSTILSSENKRLGDFAAGTLVVRDAALGLPAERAAGEPVYGATRYLSGDERALVARFLERRDALSDVRRVELAAQIAARVRDRLPPEMQAYEDEALLERL